MIFFLLPFWNTQYAWKCRKSTQKNGEKNKVKHSVVTEKNSFEILLHFYFVHGFSTDHRPFHLMKRENEKKNLNSFRIGNNRSIHINGSSVEVNSHRIQWMLKNGNRKKFLQKKKNKKYITSKEETNSEVCLSIKRRKDHCD